MSPVISLENDIEAQTLLREIEVLPLRQVDVWRAAKSWFNAFSESELMQRYVSAYDMQKRDKFDEVKKRVLYMAIVSLWIEMKMAYTVDEGSSFVIATPVPPRPSKPAHRILSRLILLLSESLDKLQKVEVRKEQKRRKREVEEKWEQAKKKALGDHKAEMVYIDLLCTSPESQGKGYASALIDTITRQMDMRGQATWLFATSVNTGFYNSFGFVSRSEVTIGDDNPKWHEDPFTFSLMVREPSDAKLRKEAVDPCKEKS